MTEAPPSTCIVNRVVRDKLPRVLTHILDKLTTDEADVFSAEETQQLKAMLSLSSAEIDAMVAFIQKTFIDAAHFEKVDRNALLTREAVHPAVVAIMEKAWRKKGKPVASQIAAKHPMMREGGSPFPVLQDTNWRLHLELGQSKLRGQTTPSAIFQMVLADSSAATTDSSGRHSQHFPYSALRLIAQDETLDLEMSHDELRAFFHQLNAIQAHLDHTQAA